MLISFLVLSLLFILITAYLYIQSGPKLPPRTDKLIKEVLSERLPQFITGKTGSAMNGDVSIYYESISGEDTSKGAILLINGHSSNMLYWLPYFYQPFLDAGYQVVRYDNRGIGMSDWLPEWTKNDPFNLEDMAQDGIAVLDALNIDKAHIIGMSMGGMIAQRMAISHSSKVLSLTSIMSSGFYHDPALTQLTPKFKSDITKLILRYGLNPKVRNRLKLHLGVMRMMEGQGGYSLDIKLTLQAYLYHIRRRDAINKKIRDQHSLAILVSGSRYDELATIKVPTLVIHGTDDPLILVEHAKKYAPMIPHAQSLIIEGMGHDIPEKYIRQIHPAIFKNLEKVTKEIV